jgi:MFS transporter, UMF1 family
MYPLRGIPQQRQLWSWISFDVANQSFTLIINTLLFSLFFAKVVVQNDAIDDRLWAVTYGASMLLTACMSPLLGAAADERACKKACLVGTGLTCGLLTCALALVQPGQVWLAMLLYIPANFAFQVGENFLASFLPALAPRDKLGLVSGFSWACSYASALVLLILTAGAMQALQLTHADQWRPFFLFSGLWFVVFAVPTMLWLREPEAARPSGRNWVVAGFSRLADSIRHTARFRDLAMLLAASLFYGTAMSVVIFFSSKLAAEYGFSDVKLVLFVAVITISGIVGTLLPMLFQDRLGHRRTTLLLLVVWLFTSCSFAFYASIHTPASPVWPLWAIGNLLGFGLGALGSANRAFVGYLAPQGRSAETFGLWGLTFKLSAIMTFPFAWIRDTAGTPAALLLLCGFVVIGFVLTLFIDEKRGHAAAQEGQPTPATMPS